MLLFRIADDVVKHGISSGSQLPEPLVEILLRRPPRLVSGAFEMREERLLPSSRYALRRTSTTRFSRFKAPQVQARPIPVRE